MSFAHECLLVSLIILYLISHFLFPPFPPSLLSLLPSLWNAKWLAPAIPWAKWGSMQLLQRRTMMWNYGYVMDIMDIRGGWMGGGLVQRRFLVDIEWTFWKLFVSTLYVEIDLVGWAQTSNCSLQSIHHTDSVTQDAANAPFDDYELLLLFGSSPMKN